MTVVIIVGVISGAAFYFFYFRRPMSAKRSSNVSEWLRNASAHPDWMVRAGSKCNDAPFLFPTDGFIGFLWSDSFYAGHHHQGIDIFGGGSVNVTPVYSVYDGYLTRQEDWKATVIIRIPSDPLLLGRQIWVYYTHMADAEGNSFIASQFPTGTYEQFVPAGTLLGYQGNYSGTTGNPVGVHLHFSIVLDDGQGGYKNELKIENTLDPTPYFGFQLNGDQSEQSVPACVSEGSATTP